jgi:hypothetical protein
MFLLLLVRKVVGEGELLVNSYGLSGPILWGRRWRGFRGWAWRPELGERRIGIRDEKDEEERGWSF